MDTLARCAWETCVPRKTQRTEKAPNAWTRSPALIRLMIVIAVAKRGLRFPFCVLYGLGGLCITRAIRRTAWHKLSGGPIARHTKVSTEWCRRQQAGTA